MPIDRGRRARSTEDHVNDAFSRIEKLERQRPTPGLPIYVQPDEPDNVPVGTLWFDTDEPV